MSIQVRPMQEAEYDAWRPRSEREYAEDMVVNGGIDRESAVRKAEQDFALLLPHGLASTGHSLYTVEDEGAAAGVLWLSEREPETGPTLFVYDVRIEESRRGRGLGRAAMQFAEEEARRRGIPRVSLNVFGGNAAARGLYRSLGYHEAAVWMEKRV
jgi:ribosomal protein S18 acetylase RimI-like enzyme